MGTSTRRPRFPVEQYGALFDAHVHTCYDLHDGLLSPADIVDLAVQHGFNWVLALNHDTVRGLDKVKRLAKEKGLPCIAGVEVSTTFNHILAYGIVEWPYRAYAWNPEEVIDHLRAQGCAIFLAHPCNGQRIGNWTAAMARRLDVDGVEWNNADNTILNQKTAKEFASLPAGRRIAGTDAHTRYTYGYAYTQVATTSTNPDDLVSAMKRGRCAPRGQYVPLVAIGREQLTLLLKNKILSSFNVDGTWIRTTRDEPASIAPDGYPPANVLSEREAKARMKPGALAWRRTLLKKPSR